MITEMTIEELVELGARHRADYLVEQAGYTLGLATAEGKPLADLLADGYLDEVKAEVDAVNAARQDRVLMEEESKEATKAHRTAYGSAKVWKRKVASRARRARRMGRNVPDGLVRIDQAASGPVLVGQVAEKVKLLEANLAAMPGKGADALLDEGKQLLGQLQTADAEHETARLASLPEAVRQFYVHKAMLYLGLKVIHDAAQELHADDHAAAARYNLSILYRNSRHRKPAPEPTPVGG